MDGLWFFLFSWIGWVWATFFMDKKNVYRFKLSLGILLLIVVSPYRIAYEGIEIQVPALILLVYILHETAPMLKGAFFSFFVSTFIMMLAYVSFLLFELFDPIWVVFDRIWMIALTSICICSLLQSNYRIRIAILVSGLLQGEIVYSIVMKRLLFPYPVAALAFMDILAVSIMVLAVWAGLSHIAFVAGTYINQGRGKQKTS
jgi:hypothetical protein